MFPTTVKVDMFTEDHARHAQEVETEAMTDWLRATAETACPLNEVKRSVD